MKDTIVMVIALGSPSTAWYTFAKEMSKPNDLRIPMMKNPAMIPAEMKKENFFLLITFLLTYLDDLIGHGVLWHIFYQKIQLY